jgi:hypothetical protein
MTNMHNWWADDWQEKTEVAKPHLVHHKFHVDL